MGHLTSTSPTLAVLPGTAPAPPGRATRLRLRRWWVVAVGLAVLWGVVAGALTPRSPQTTGAAMASIVVSLAVGVAAGLLTRSRWAVVLVPAAFAVAFEIVRLRVEGPTVDAPHLSTYGVFAFVVGRGFHALLSLLPLAVGAAWGALAAARRDGHLPAGRGRRALRWTAVAASVVVVAGLAFLVARPASTAPITGVNGEPVPGSIAELTSINVNGRELGMMIRGHDIGNPVLLFLAGGPGGSERGAMRNHLPELEKDFTVATLDQRGTGTSYPALDPIGTYTLESAVEDTIATTTYLRERFGVERVVLVGQSWGTILGVLAVQREPTLYSAFVGVGQMVSPVETDRVFYTDTLAWAREARQTGLASKLERIGPPPYTSMLDYETALSSEQRVYPYDHWATARARAASRRTSSCRSTRSSIRSTCSQGSWTPSERSTPASKTSTCGGTRPRSRSRCSSSRAPTRLRVAPHRLRARYAQLAAPTKELVVLNRSGPPAAVRTTRRVRRVPDLTRAAIHALTTRGAVRPSGPGGSPAWLRGPGCSCPAPAHAPARRPLRAGTPGLRAWG